MLYPDWFWKMNWLNSVSRSTNTNGDFGLIWIWTMEFECFDLVDFGRAEFPRICLISNSPGIIFANLLVMRIYIHIYAFEYSLLICILNCYAYLPVDILLANLRVMRIYIYKYIYIFAYLPVLCTLTCHVYLPVDFLLAYLLVMRIYTYIHICIFTCYMHIYMWHVLKCRYAICHDKPLHPLQVKKK